MGLTADIAYGSVFHVIVRVPLTAIILDYCGLQLAS